MEEGEQDRRVMSEVDKLFRDTREVLASSMSHAAKCDIVFRGCLGLVWKATFPSFWNRVIDARDSNEAKLWDWWVDACAFLGRPSDDPEVTRWFTAEIRGRYPA